MSTIHQNEVLSLTIVFDEKPDDSAELSLTIKAPLNIPFAVGQVVSHGFEEPIGFRTGTIHSIAHDLVVSEVPDPSSPGTRIETLQSSIQIVVQ